MSRRHSAPSPWELRARPAGSAALVLLAGVLVCALAWFWQYRLAPEDSTPSSAAGSPVRINELMSSNKSAHSDPNGAYSDWIELINPSDQAVDITGWMLSDGGSIFTFPQHVLGPHETVLVYASGSLHALPGEAFFAPFRLSASGETITLTDSFETPIDTVELPALEPNFSYALAASGQWEATPFFTPGLDNSQAYSAAEDTILSTGLVISEVMPSNASYIPDEDESFSDWIEIYNSTSSAVSLKGYTLSDDEAKKDKWAFPDVSIGPGEYLLVYASGKEQKSSQLHASFSLSADGETLLLCSPAGQIISKMSYASTEPDVSWSRTESGAWSCTLSPTPGYSNDASGAARLEAEMRSANTDKIFINEVMASTRIPTKEVTGTGVVGEDEAAPSYDWVELYNASENTVDLSGWGLSDNTARPRKWQFPEGASIGPGQYMIVVLNGEDTAIDGIYHASFSLSLTEPEAVILCCPDGTPVDRTPLIQQYAEVSYGRMPGQDGFFLLEEATPGEANQGSAYVGRAQTVAFSEAGGIKSSFFTLTLTAGEGETIYYTTDCTDPTASSTLYTGPIEISSTTVVRAVSTRDGWMDSLSSTHTYLFGTDHTLPVVSLVSDPDGMFSDRRGMYTNIDEYWSRDAHIEYFTLDGQTLFSQGAEISLHGHDARNYQQKTMNVIARSEYGDNRFRASIFPNRDYTEYQSFLLRPSSEDGNYTRMRCSVLSTLAEDTTVMYQDVVVAVLYINGEYWGHYNLRERTNAHAIAQWEDWTDPDAIDLVKGNTDTRQGSNETFQELRKWLRNNTLDTREELEYVNSIVDIENYLDYVMIEMFVANSDLLNVKRYRSEEGDGRWRWVLFDLDWAFHNDFNSYSDWLSDDGAGVNDADNLLFRSLMENAEVKEYFLRLLGERMAGPWSSESIIAKIDERQALLEPEMEATYSRWSNSLSRWYEKVDEMREYARTRPAKLVAFIAKRANLTDEQIEEYFGEALRANPID